jgi:hypothetical protein
VHENRVKVLYVLGSYRSGTTVLSNLIGQQDRFFTGGEINACWRELANPAGRCGCGAPLVECEVWSQVLETAFGEAGDKVRLAERLQELRDDELGAVHSWRRAGPLLRRGAQELAARAPLAEYARALGSLYRAIAEVTGADVVVDSSKEASDAALVRLLPGVAPYFVHIVRDPRGTVYSGLRKQAGGQQVTHPQPGRSAYAALSWSVGNRAAHAVRRAHGTDRSLLVRYEDFVRDPAATLRRIVQLVGEPVREADLPTAAAVFRPTHTVAGNENRFRTGVVRLEEDVAWRQYLHPADRAVIGTIAAPVLQRLRGE